MKHKYSVLQIALALVYLVLLIVASAIVGVFIELGKIQTEANSFLVMFVILLGGIGLYLLVFGIVVKGGYEFSVGGILTTMALVMLGILLKWFWVITLIVALAFMGVCFVGLLLLKVNFLHIQTTDDKEGFVPYEEKLKAQKEQEKKESEELPEIKSFK